MGPNVDLWVQVQIYGSEGRPMSLTVDLWV